jgi:hypothetical protein
MQNKRPRSPAADLKIWSLGLIPALIALFVPESILEVLPWLRGYITSVTIVVPGAIDYAKYSTFPNATALAVTTAYTVLPIQIVWMFIKTKHSEFFTQKIVDSVKAKPIRITLMVVGALAASLIGFLFIGKDPRFCPGCTNNNRLGLAFLLFWAGGGIAMVASIVLNIITNVSEIFSKNCKG